MVRDIVEIMRLLKLLPFFLLGLSLSLNVMANSDAILGNTRVLNIEKDIVFKTILTELKSPGTHFNLYIESENYRFDLTLKDLVDQVTLISLNKKFEKHYQILKEAYSSDADNFVKWYLTLNEIIQEDEAFYKKINRKLHVLIYSKNGIALPPEYGVLSLKKLLDNGLLVRIKKYNKVANDPEGKGLLLTHKKIQYDGFYTSGLTVAKFKELSSKQMNKVHKAYYKVYNQLLMEQFLLESSQSDFSEIRFHYSKRNGSKVKRHLKKNKMQKKAIKIANVLYGLAHKNSLYKYLAHELGKENIIVPYKNGHFLITPFFILKHWESMKSILKEFTIAHEIDNENDDFLLEIRKWVSKNTELIQIELEKFNQLHSTNHQLNLIANKRPSRLQTIECYDFLETLFPQRPWFSDKFLKSIPTLYDKNGRKKYLGKGSFGIRIKNFFKSIIKIENYASLLVGSAVYFLNGGNAAFALGARSLTKKAILTGKHNREWEEFLKEAPLEVVTSFLLGAGFSSGRLYKILALGAGSGMLQSLLTGQDVKVGAAVGAGINFINYYLLPVKWAKPMVKGFDQKSLNKNIFLEIAHTTTKTAIQGTLVAGFTGEDMLTGALKGGLYGSVSSALTIWFLGTRYFPFKDYDAADVDTMIANENAFQNEVGRGGEYVIDRQLIMDANHRVNGVLPELITASIALPGNVVMSDTGFSKLTTLTHEASHLMQQHQSGVYGFYLFRYIPTALRTGYDGHPDENFLESVLGSI